MVDFIETFPAFLLNLSKGNIVFSHDASLFLSDNTSNV